MSTPAVPAPHELERPGSTCPACSAALAPDQRYCLNCGHRLSEPRVDYRRTLGLEPGGSASATGPSGATGAGRDQRGVLVVLVAVAAIVLALGVGIVIGRGNGPSAVGGKTTVVTVAAGGTAAGAAAGSTGGASTAGTANAASVVSEDWPTGASGWTVELDSLSSTATAADVASAKSAATTKGASAVGVLTGDQHAGTPTGKYVIYSGRFATQKQAKAAQHKLAGKFPGALVLHVKPKSSAGSAGGSNATASNAGASQAAAAHNLGGSAYEKASSKLPSTVGTGGSAPPTDTKKAGGGTSGSCIGC
jgi:hypothetical protein